MKTPSVKRPTLLILLGLGLVTAAIAFISQYQGGTGIVYEQMAKLKAPDYDSTTMYESQGMAEPAMYAEDESYAAGGITTLNRQVMPSSGGDIAFAPMPYYPDDALEVANRVYQKSASFDVVTKNVADYARSTKEYILSVEGRVLSSSVSTSGKYEVAYIYAKVPVAKFEEATSRLTENVKKVVNENISANDRTGQYVGAIATVDQLNEQKLAKQAELEKAKTDAEKRMIQYQIDKLDKQIKAAEQSIENVETEVSYASIYLQAANNERYFNGGMINNPGLWDQVVAAWESVSSILYLIVIFTIWVVVYSIVWLPLVLIVKWVVRLIKGKK